MRSDKIGSNPEIRLGRHGGLVVDSINRIILDLIPASFKKVPKRVLIDECGAFQAIGIAAIPAFPTVDVVHGKKRSHREWCEVVIAQTLRDVKSAFTKLGLKSPVIETKNL